jgi:hypothetical protein
MPRLLAPLLSAALAAIPAPLRPAPAADDPAEVALEAGRLALAEGRAEDAYRHFAAAFVLRPGADVAVLAMRAVADDAEALRLWAHAWYAAAGDDAGRVRPPREAAELLPDDPWLARLALARAAAVKELTGFAEGRAKKGAKDPAELLVAWWARRAARDLAQHAPAVAAAYADASAPALDLPRGFHAPTVKALERALGRALSGREVGAAMRAARVLHGLAVQAGFKDLQGERPSDMGRVRASAANGIVRARQLLEAEVGEPWTLEDLDWLTTPAGEAFTREHDSFALPGVALSPRGWYRVETDCGFETLRGVAATIEQHHERLAGWYGADPFEGRPGLVRIVPDASGLEAEGAPFFWAGGFQSGDVTTMRFSCGTLEGLGHGLTHELTHRFDAALFPGQPAWLTEGKAVWTGSAYGPASDRGFVANHASSGTLQGVWIDGYGDLRKLTQLIEGTPEDYRDNYTAGYALYVYLNTWERDGRRLFQERLLYFMEHGAREGRDRKAFFEQCFCDGAQGRPASLDEFARGFHDFVKGFYWKDPQPFTSRYTGSVPPTPPQAYVYDEPTWVWSRNRAEPYFGDEQARLAGELLLDLGQEDDAARALVWAMGADGRSPRIEELAGYTLEDVGERDGAWVAWQQRLFPHWHAEEPAPFIGSLARTRELLAGLAEAAEEYTAAGLNGAGAALAADHDRLAAWLGTPLLEYPRRATPPRGFGRGARPLAMHGWVEESLTGYDKERDVGLWYDEPDGDVVVGRKRPRTGTGLVDRGGGGVCFVRAQDYQLPGTYRVKTRVQFTTSFGYGALVVGYTRRDRNVRVNVVGGDYQYSIGESDEEPAFDSVGWGVDGLYVREGPLAGSRPGGRAEFGRKRTAFELEVLVDGASMQVFIEGERVCTYHTPDGAPIEGHVGFATSRGALRYQAPRVERLERERLANAAVLPPLGLELASARTAPPFAELQGRPIYGVAPAVQGSLLLWIPTPEPADEDDPLGYDDVDRKARRAMQKLAEAIAQEGATQHVIVALPACIGAERLAELEEEMRAELEPPPTFVHHALDGTPPPGMHESPDLRKRWLFFVDPAGVARVATPFYAHEAGFDAGMAHWLRVFRDHGRPPRELPRPERASLAGSADD